MNAPTLLVGLGGCGCKIIERVAKLAANASMENLAFAAFDTDVNELRPLEKRNPFIRTIQTSTKQSVGEYLEIDPHARDTWFPVNAMLNSKTMTEGAGQVRSISRLAFESAVRAGKMEPLHEAIQSLFKVEEDKAEQALRVIIVSSLAGGTGSGLLLPVAMYIKQYLTSHFRQSANIIRGFFILPEVFYHVIPGQDERNNLRANAYAALRELDAFLMKGDGTLPEQFASSVSISFPKVASEGYEEYSVRPYDYCFLFDAQNAEGGKLNSYYQYLDHAANCIYAQSIGPMNTRSNSSEDNTIRKLAKARGRNRYAGAGASLLLYPFADVKRYIALQWAKECISKQWLVFDKEYYDFCNENKRRQAEGLFVLAVDPNTHYVKVIKEREKNRDPFARAIVQACSQYKADGVTKEGDKWVFYIARLKDKVIKDIKNDNRVIESHQETIRADMENLKIDWSDYGNLYFSIDTLKKIVFNYAEETAGITAYSMFKASREFRTSAPEPYELEYYLYDGEGKFMHPCAVRYFLNEALAVLQAELHVSEESLVGLNEYFANIETTLFDDGSTERVETVEDLSEKRVRLLNKLSKKPSTEQQEFRNNLRFMIEQIKTYHEEYTLNQIYKAGIEYIKNLLDTFSKFFNTFETRVSGIDRTLHDITVRYVNAPGSTTRYVCADALCLNAMAQQKRYVGSAISIDSGLAKAIYYGILDCAMRPGQPANDRHFCELFENDILGYFETTLMERYGSEIDIDVIDALRNEAIFTHPDYVSSANCEKLLTQYITDTIENTRALSCPFIEAPMGQPRDAINACAFNKSMFEDAIISNPGKGNFISSMLLDFGGEADDSIPKYQIMFYQSIYALRANELSKFAPPEKSATYTRNGGEYFKAYYELIENIHPKSELSTEISPSINRWWHIVTKMPDLDDDFQKQQEQEIYAAFFWGILCNYITYIEDTRDCFLYKIDKEELDLSSDDFIVSDGSKCDRLYEVLDAIAIYPALVRKLLAKVDNKTTDDVSRGRPLANGLLMHNINRFSVDSPCLYDGQTEKRATSVFSLPLLMRKSSSPELYYEENVIRLLHSIIAEIRKYLCRFCNEKELPDIMGDLLKEQFNKYLTDMAFEHKSRPSIYRESLFNATCSVISKALASLGLEDDARAIKDKVIELRM